MRSLPPLTELRAFEAAARHLSFKGAASELGVTPTAISHQVKLLEQNCGRPLFHRRPAPVRLTIAGEELFFAVRDGLDAMANGFSRVRGDASGSRLSVTTTNAFAARWLVPRIPRWRSAYPDVSLSVIGTDTVLNIDSGDADLAIRYAVRPPQASKSIELVRDTFRIVASPCLIGNRSLPYSAMQLVGHTLIEAEWPPGDANAPNWQRWQKTAEEAGDHAPDLTAYVSLRFREELHAIEAAIAGQGIAICSDVLVAAELSKGTLVVISPISLPGYGFYILHRAGRVTSSASAFVNWAQAAVAEEP
jgi:LysR family transcriptional regulator, glycine cleavage system transcriptional activator